MSCFQTITNCLPSLTICILTLWSYYVFVVIICFSLITDNNMKQYSYLTFYHLIFIMTVWCYITTVFKKTGGVPPIYKPASLVLQSATSLQVLNEIIEAFCRRRRIVVYTTNKDGTIRFCSTCEHVKPDRTHHCSTCKQCVLKMDHHCPWVNNCVGYANQKQFVLALIYGVIYCIFCFGTSLEYVYGFFYEDLIENYFGYHIIGMAVCSFSFGIMIASLLSYHLSLISQNKTTLEDMRAPKFVDVIYTFNLGGKENFYEVFGEACCLWFLPFTTARGDGCEFPVELRY